MIKQIFNKEELLGIIVTHDFQKDGIEFFTENDLSQQLAFMSHQKGHEIIPHYHNPVPRIIHYTQETLFIRKGKLRVDFYDNEQIYLESHILEAGDVVLLVSGGHGFEVIENLEMFEVKQGPFVGAKGKTRFKAINQNELKVQD